MLLTRPSTAELENIWRFERLLLRNADGAFPSVYRVCVGVCVCNVGKSHLFPSLRRGGRRYEILQMGLGTAAVSHGRRLFQEVAVDCVAFTLLCVG